MYYIYVLHSRKDKGLYVGFTENIERRVDDHNRGYNLSTASRIPLQLIYFEAFANKFDALRRERYMKTTKGHVMIKTILREHLASKPA